MVLLRKVSKKWYGYADNNNLLVVRQRVSFIALRTNNKINKASTYSIATATTRDKLVSASMHRMTRGSVFYVNLALQAGILNAENSREIGF